MAAVLCSVLMLSFKQMASPGEKKLSKPPSMMAWCWVKCCSACECVRT